MSFLVISFGLVFAVRGERTKDCTATSPDNKNTNRRDFAVIVLVVEDAANVC